MGLSANPDLDWSSPAPGTYTRPLDTLETFYKILADSGKPLNREHWAITVSLRLKFPDSIEDPAPYLRRTWLAVRRLHPHIGAKPSPTGEASITIPSLDGDGGDEWLAESFFVHAGEEVRDADEAFSTLRPAETATAHWLPASGELVLRSSHWRMEGIGMLMLCHSFMSTLTSVLRFGVNASPKLYKSAVGRGSLSPSLDALAGSHLAEEDTPEHLTKAADGLCAEFIKGVPSIGLPTTEGSETAVPGATVRTYMDLDVPTSQAVKAACTRRGISVASAVHTAVIRATASYPQHPLARSYASFFGTDLRKYLPRPYNTGEYAGGMYCSGLPLHVPDVLDSEGSGSFAAVSRHVSSVYKTDLGRFTTDEAGRAVSMLKVVAPFVRRTTRLFSTPPPPGLPPTQNPDLSNLGMLEKHLQRQYYFGWGLRDRVEVTDFWCGVDVLARSCYMHAWTFRDRVRLQSCFNESFYSRAFMDEVLARVEFELLEGLGLGLPGPSRLGGETGIVGGQEEEEEEFEVVNEKMHGVMIPSVTVVCVDD